jgi:phosphoglycolate phosphatase
VNNRYEHLIFDFDGTLVDSAPAILACFREVLAAHAIVPQIAIDSRLIGPPLLQTLALVSGLTDDAAIRELAEDFKHRYDGAVALRTPTYPGIGDALAHLAAAGYHLHIATNKRMQPTRLILDQLGLMDCFATIYALDRGHPPYAHKTAMIAAQLFEQGLPVRQACYIGDKLEDGQAADANQLDFFAAIWGYGEWTKNNWPNHWRLVENISMLNYYLLD